MENKEASLQYIFSEETEKKILNLILTDYKYTSSVGIEVIKPIYFSTREMQNICKQAYIYLNKYKINITKDSLINKINEQNLPIEKYMNYMTLVEDIYNSSIEDQEFIKDQVIDFAKKSEFFNALCEAKKIYDTSKDYDKAVGLFQKIEQIGIGIDIGIKFSDIIDKMPEILRSRYAPESTISTGLPTLDKYIGGGWTRDNLSILAAVSGGGKSRSLSIFARNALKQNKKVLFITLELQEDEEASMIASSFTNLTITDIMNKESQLLYIERIQQYKNLSENLRIKYYNPGKYNCNTLQAYVNRLIFQENFTPDIIFIDYLDKLLPIDFIKGNKYEDLGNVCIDVINLAVQFHIPVVSASQLNRGALNLKGDELCSVESISDSANKTFLASNVITLNANAAEKQLGKVRLFTAKSRWGQNKVIFCGFDMGRNQLEETEPWDSKSLFDAADIPNIKVSEDKKKK